MKTRKLLSRLHKWMSLKQRKQLTQIDSIRKVLKKLKKKQSKLEQELANSQGQDQQEDINTKLRIVRAQRLKGIQAMRTLMNKKDVKKLEEC